MDVGVVVVRMGDRVELDADQLLLRVTGYLAERLVDAQQHSGAVALDADQRHPDRRLVERPAEALLRLAQDLLRLLSLSLVVADGEDETVRGRGGGAPEHRKIGAVGAADASPEVPRLDPGSAQALGLCLHSHAVVRVDEVDVGMVHQGRERDAEHLLERWIDSPPASLEVHDREQVGRELDEPRALFLELLAAADVLGDQVDQFLLGQRCCRHEKPFVGAVVAAQPNLEPERAVACGGGAGDLREHALLVLEVNEIEIRPADELLAAEADDSLVGRTGPLRAAVVAGDREQVVGDREKTRRRALETAAPSVGGENRDGCVRCALHGTCEFGGAHVPGSASVADESS